MSAGKVGPYGQTMIAAELVQADAMHCLDGGIDSGTGQPRVSLGNKAILFAELCCQGAVSELHSGDSAWVVNPAWPLVQALNTLVDGDGRVPIPGWYDDWDEPTQEDIAWPEKALASFDLKQKKAILGVSSLPPGKSPLDLFVERSFGATCTICGLKAGHAGPGAKPAAPPSAVCNLDFRCPPYLNPLVQLEKLEAQVAAGGFDDVEVHVITARCHPWAHPDECRHGPGYHPCCRECLWPGSIRARRDSRRYHHQSRADADRAHRTKTSPLPIISEVASMRRPSWKSMGEGQGRNPRERQCS